MVITIFQGDEHKAKMEKQFSETDFFAGAYRKAYQLVCEIEEEMERYRKEIDKNKGRLSRYRGMGNNRIIFCGGRGQGKTSVMQSFAKCLDGSYKEEKSDGSAQLAFVKELVCEKYEVVDSIDPSAMENGESILRVLISRLFFKLEEYIKSDDCPSKDDKNFLQNKKDIVKLFEKCYANIECIKNGKGVDCGQDDLQTLSQMGSSAQLKENLYDLIRIYLDMMPGGNKCGKDTSRYLVIPIDDADLVTKRLFQLCEDIRNYLSIPNVIILMAVDYEQLVHATYQRYLKQYKVMRKADVFSKHKSYVDRECHEMAAKYLEKVFPVMHRVDLPRIDNLLEEEFKNVRFDYKRWNDKGVPESAFTGAALDQSENMQKQLLKLLYMRTGMLFIGDGDGLHPFMPHTLRELTHWVKMLYDMQEINITKDSMTEKAAEKILQLKDNIQTMKQYFISYWCEKYLDISATRVFQRIDSGKIKHIIGSKEIDSQELGKVPTAVRVIYKEIKSEIGESKFDADQYIKDAVSIYATIFLNEWFASALANDRQFGDIANFVGRTIDLSDYNEANKYNDKYNIMRFNINADVLRGTLGDDIESSTAQCLRSFCAVVENGEIKDSVNVLKVVERRVQINPEVKTLEFDILRPVIRQLQQEEIHTKEDSNRESDMLTEKERQEKAEQTRIADLVTAKNIIANCDVQKQLHSIIDIWYKAGNAERRFASLGEQIVNLYEAIHKNLKILQSESDCQMMGIYDKTGAENNEVINVIFLCNRKNFTNYIKQVGDELEVCLDETAEKAKEFDRDIKSNNRTKIADLQRVIESVLDNLNEGVGKVCVSKDRLYKMASLWNLNISSGWIKVDRMYRKINKEIDQLRKLKADVDDQVAAAANVPQSESSSNEPPTTMAE